MVGELGKDQSVYVRKGVQLQCSAVLEFCVAFVRSVVLEGLLLLLLYYYGGTPSTSSHPCSRAVGIYFKGKGHRDQGVCNLHPGCLLQA